MTEGAFPRPSHEEGDRGGGKRETGNRHRCHSEEAKTESLDDSCWSMEAVADRG